MNTISLNHSNASRMIPEYFEIGWFRFPPDPNNNYEVVKIVNEILVVFTFLPNPLLLWMIAKNPGRKPRSNTAILMANLCVVNLIAAGVALMDIIDYRSGSNVLSHKVKTIILSIILPMYYPCMVLSTLIYYAIIVKPIHFKNLDPRKVRTVKVSILCLWLLTTAIFLITPFFVQDFEFYVKVMMTCVTCGSWIVTVFIAYLYIRILHTLFKRNRDLKNKFQASTTRQGMIVIRQNVRLAKLLLCFIISLVISTLPLLTLYLFILYSPESVSQGLARLCLYTTPLFLIVPASYAVHWLLGIPQYYRELKRLLRGLFMPCRSSRRVKREIDPNSSTQ